MSRLAAPRTAAKVGLPMEPDPHCLRLHFRLPLGEITYVRYVVEAYDGLAVVSSRPGVAEVTWTVPRSRRDEAEALARALGEEIGLEPLPPPRNYP